MSEFGRGHQAAVAVRSAILRLRYEMGGMLGRFPTVHLPLMRMYLWLSGRSFGPQTVRRDTQLVIEGFPRCANSFVVAAFINAQRSPVRIAHHVHAASQVIAGVRQGIPVLVLVREPAQAVLSFAVYAPQVPIARGLARYVHFHRCIESYHDQYLVADFNQVIKDFGRVIDRLNRRFCTDFDRFDHCPENVERCFDWIRQQSRQFHHNQEEIAQTIGIPSEERRRRKAALLEQWEHPDLGELRSQAEDLYKSFRQLAESGISPRDAARIPDRIVRAGAEQS